MSFVVVVVVVVGHNEEDEDDDEDESLTTTTRECGLGGGEIVLTVRSDIDIDHMFFEQSLEIASPMYAILGMALLAQ